MVDKATKGKVTRIENEGVEQAKMLMRTGQPEAVFLATAVLVSTAMRVEVLQGKTPVLGIG
jgi:hypothetical protein